MKTAGRIALMVIAAGLALATGFWLNPANNRGDAHDSATSVAQLMAASLPDMEGKSQPLAQWRGKVLIVNFWATWCPPCLEEIPDLVAIKESRKDLEVIGIAMEFQDAKQVMQFADGMFVNYPIVLGDRKISESIGRVDGLPTTFIYDPQGQARRAARRKDHPQTDRAPDRRQENQAIGSRRRRCSGWARR